MDEIRANSTVGGPRHCAVRKSNLDTSGGPQERPQQAPRDLSVDRADEQEGRQTVYWPGITNEITTFLATFSTCYGCLGGDIGCRGGGFGG